MGIVMNTTGVVAEERNSITEGGNYLLKIVKVEQDGYDSNGNPKAKLSFEGKKIEGKELGTDTYTMMEWLETTEKMAWKVARLRDALKSPESFDLDDWIGRFIVATVEMNTYNNKTNPQFRKLQYSKANDKLPPIPETKQGNNEPENVVNAPEIEIDTDEIPF